MLLATLVALQLNLATPLATVDERYLSFALDTAQLVGGKWWDKSAKPTTGRGQANVPPFDFENPRLIKLTRALAPAFFRVGGSEADLVAYQFPGNEPKSGRRGFESTLTAKRWDALNEFVRATDTALAFTLNAGPGTLPAENRPEGRALRAAGR